MKKAVPYTVLFSLFVFGLALGSPGEAWSAPKGKLVMAFGVDPSTLDPPMFAEIQATNVVTNIYECLVNRVFKEGKIQHEPMLATSWELINDTTWIFRLKKGVKFHNGEDFNAEAVKYTFERILNPAQKARRRYLISSVERVDIVDPYTVRIITKVPQPAFIVNLGFGIWIVPPKYFKEKGDAYVATHPVGTGPYKFVRWVKDEEIVLEANETYYGGAPAIKTVVFKPIPDDSTRVAALLGGDVDIAKNVPINLIPMVNKSDRAKVMVTPAGLTISVKFETMKAGSPLQDKRIRQAINYGVDKEAIIKHIMEGHGTPVGTPLSPSHIGYAPDIKPYSYNPEKAKALLKEAGYERGLTLTLHAPSGRYMKDKEFAEAIAYQLAEVGINLKVQTYEWGSYTKILYSPDPVDHMLILGWGSTFDPDGILSPNLQCGESLSRYCNKQLDSLLTQARGTMDPKKRMDLYHRALQMIHEEAPFLFLWQGVDTYGVSNRVQHWSPTPDESFTAVMQRVSLKD